MKKLYTKPNVLIYKVDTSNIIAGSPNSYQQSLLDGHKNFYWDGEHVRNPGGRDMCGASEYRNNLWE